MQRRQPAQRKAAQKSEASHPGRIEDALRIGRELRQLRQAKRMTLTELARHTDLSIGLLSQIERGRSPLAVPTLMKISKALNVPMSFFFSSWPAEDGGEGDIIVRRGRRRQLTFPGLGIRDDLLSPDLSGPIEMLLCTIESGADCGEAYSHAGNEAGLILEGSLDLWVGPRHFHLEAGDSFSFASTIPHYYRNDGPGATKVIWIITPPFY